MTSEMRAVSFRGDEATIKALKVIASQKDVAVGDLVADAVNALYGDELRPHIESFRAKSGQQNDQNGQLSDHTKGVAHVG